jgi:hypothetical protein
VASQRARLLIKRVVWFKISSNAMNDAEVAYNELKSLTDFLEAFVKAKSKLVHDAGITLEGKSGDPAALQAFAVHLRGIRQDLLSDLKSRPKYRFYT